MVIRSSRDSGPEASGASRMGLYPVIAAKVTDGSTHDNRIRWETRRICEAP